MSSDKKKYLLDDSSNDAGPSDDYIAYTNGADGPDAAQAAKRKRYIIIGVVGVVVFLLLAGIIGYAMSRSDDSGGGGGGGGQPDVWTQFRLPANVMPSAYSLLMHIDTVALQFSGDVTVSAAITGQPMPALVLHSMGLIIDSVSASVGGTNASTPAFTWLLFGQNENDTQYLVLIATAPYVFPVTDSLSITVSFHRDLPTNTSSGLYATSYVDGNGATQIIAATQFEPTHARRAFPCFDELQMKAVFTITMETRAGQVALTNGLNQSTTPIDGGFQRVVFAATARQSSYLIAFAVANNYAYVQAKASGSGGMYAFKDWGRSDRIAAEGQFYVDRAFAAVQTIHSLMGTTYPLSKLDQIAVPNKGGAMEVRPSLFPVTAHPPHLRTHTLPLPSASLRRCRTTASSRTTRAGCTSTTTPPPRCTKAPSASTVGESTSTRAPPPLA